ncbi:hypothetical protein RTM1035_09723 [Roseovarius sp. TM1035]|uniref:hypothetical protein n=1 Tax=Roseovarius TaxID=74030 RepID=UPI00015567FD|nr:MULTISPECIES: hypothetical protein [Roseovarius]EDM29964.1 hypothetical protein RTM1035_09723 [Roseovarius sp. TM1035]MBW4972287.1 hypothetical protein [Roseovarius mucosus]|tara:strand:- start:5739 stop:6191 length:453 start_codon:yes stop_codon:yes gene_type:complete
MDEHRNFARKQHVGHGTKLRAQFTEYAVAGLRKSDYAGVFQKTKDRGRPAWLAEIKLDGFQRSLFIKLWSAVDKAGNIRRLGLLQGLPLTFEKRSFDLIVIPEGVDRFHGIVELQDARLIINVFPAPARGKRRVYLCHLEVARSDGSVEA